MSLKNYGVLKGRPIGRRLGTQANAHYQVHIVDNTTDYRIAVNVQSKLSPSELEYLVMDRFQHPIIDALVDLPLGFTKLPAQPGGAALDFIRGNLFDRTQMIPLPFDVPGPNNDLNETIDSIIQQAMGDENALVYAFGERWKTEPTIKDKIFGFLPGNGIHDIHMNQGNAAQFKGDDGVWQDGGLLVHFPQQQRWVAIFLKFQSQAWHTDDVTGHTIPSPVTGPTPTPTPIPGGQPGEPDGVIRIVAAMVNPIGGQPERETVTILNTSPDEIDLSGWALADKAKRKHGLSGKIA
ncbi:MAG: DUF2278 family protein, partial [Chitinophagaceae bacterium]|nr:DUF2278 family protein [Anaerolineae bacterium]